MTGAHLPFGIGDVIAGKYRVERVLGMGGMGVVLAARHTLLDELCAIKVLLPESAKQPKIIQRFLQEAKVALKLKSEHAVNVYDVGMLESGLPYMTMEYLEGQDLDAFVKQVGPLRINHAVNYVLQALEAIAEAHGMGIIHRDLKPSNLFLSTGADGTPCIKVLDFGISKVTQMASKLTGTGELLGTPHYMAPEQLASDEETNLQVDIWSIGVILYNLVTGTTPFHGTTTTMLCISIIQTEPRRPSELRPDLPITLEQTILRCLCKVPEQRYANVAELARSLQPLLLDITSPSLGRITRTVASSSQWPAVRISSLPAPPPQPTPLMEVPTLSAAPIPLIARPNNPTNIQTVTKSNIPPPPSGRTDPSWGHTNPQVTKQWASSNLIIAGTIALATLFFTVSLAVAAVYLTTLKADKLQPPRALAQIARSTNTIIHSRIKTVKTSTAIPPAAPPPSSSSVTNAALPPSPQNKKLHRHPYDPFGPKRK